jgi:hypothetical protein
MKKGGRFSGRPRSRMADLLRAQFAQNAMSIASYRSQGKVMHYLRARRRRCSRRYGEDFGQLIPAAIGIDPSRPEAAVRQCAGAGFPREGVGATPLVVISAGE